MIGILNTFVDFNLTQFRTKQMKHVILVEDDTLLIQVAARK